MPKPTSKPRVRDLGLPCPGVPGRFNAIADVPGVRVGFCTPTDPAKAMRTGVTAIRPRNEAGAPQPVWAGQFTLNGNGEMTGTHWIQDAGYFIGPVCITNTHGVGAVHHGVTEWMMEHYAAWFDGEHAWAMPVVGETCDGILNDINVLHVTPDHARQTIRAAKGGWVEKGPSGGGDGMIAYEFKGGTGTASRVVGLGGCRHTLGVLVQANHGRRGWLNILGQPVGEQMPEGPFRDKEQGSIIGMIATDAPLSALGLQHLARRASLGVARGGTPAGNSSGDIFLAFSTANAMPMPPANLPVLTKIEINNEVIDPLYLAAVEAVEEAIVNALVAGVDVAAIKPKGLVVRALDTGALAALFAR